MAFTKFELLTSPSSEKIRILSILFLTTQRDPRKFPASTAVPILALPSSYLKVPNDVLRQGEYNDVQNNTNTLSFIAHHCNLFLSFLPVTATSLPGIQSASFANMAVMSLEHVNIGFQGFLSAEDACKNPRKPRFAQESFRSRQGELQRS